MTAHRSKKKKNLPSKKLYMRSSTNIVDYITSLCSLCSTHSWIHDNMVLRIIMGAVPGAIYDLSNLFVARSLNLYIYIYEIRKPVDLAGIIKPLQGSCIYVDIVVDILLCYYIIFRVHFRWGSRMLMSSQIWNEIRNALYYYVIKDIFWLGTIVQYLNPLERVTDGSFWLNITCDSIYYIVLSF